MVWHDYFLSVVHMYPQVPFLLYLQYLSRYIRITLLSELVAPSLLLGVQLLSSVLLVLCMYVLVRLRKIARVLVTLSSSPAPNLLSHIGEGAHRQGNQMLDSLIPLVSNSKPLRHCDKDGLPLIKTAVKEMHPIRTPVTGATSVMLIPKRNAHRPKSILLLTVTMAVAIHPTALSLLFLLPLLSPFKILGLPRFNFSTLVTYVLKSAQSFRIPCMRFAHACPRHLQPILFSLEKHSSICPCLHSTPTR